MDFLDFLVDMFIYLFYLGGFVAAFLLAVVIPFETLRTIYQVKVLKRGNFEDYGIFGQMKKRY